jgi:hypothetical protein
MQKESFAEQKIITVSGLYSGIGKTELCQHIICLLPGIAALKVTINDRTTEVLDDEASIMVAGKDTWRLKASGAGQVVWVRAQEKRLKDALAEALKRVGATPLLLIEGNSVLGHIAPALAFFLCDSLIFADKPPKPSRAEALARADIIINNVRAGADAAQSAVRAAIKPYNTSAQVYDLDVTDKLQTALLLKALLRERGYLPAH